MAAPCSIFISYSHLDEWLKDELIKHLAALKRNGLVDVWHDRRIPAGGLINDEIDARIKSSNLFLFLVSPDFISSDYCYEKEYEAALHRHATGDAEVVPIIIRPCDWDVGHLKSFNALPPDGVAITRDGVSKADSQQRDGGWLKVIDGLKTVIEHFKKKSVAPELLAAYRDSVFEVDFLKHPALAKFDERLILVEPDVYCESGKEQVTTFERLFDLCSVEKATIITGSDRSGKSVIAKQLQRMLSDAGHPAVLLSGKQIKNKDIARIISTARTNQFAASTFPINKFRVIIDDFDECTLPDQIKETIVKTICDTYDGCVILSFSNAPSVLFTSTDLPNPAVFRINAITDSKLYQLVQKWVSIGLPPGELAPDASILQVYERLQLVFDQTGIEKAPYAAATFLQLLDSAMATDITFSSFAACYDSLILNKLSKANVSVSSFDEARNFLSLVAYRAYSETGSAHISDQSFQDCLTMFEEQYLSSRQALKRMAVGPFMREDDGGFAFYEEYLWYFLCARYVVRTLQVQDHAKYVQFVSNCTTNIFQKKFANIVIFIAYFSTDKFVLESLLQTLDGLFSKANNWIISDETRELMVGLMKRDALEIESKSDVSSNRLVLLQEKIADIIADATRVVARYTLPFLSPKIGDSIYVEGIDVAAIDADSYMRSVNALLRTHSVIGQILSGRSGTYSASFVLDCITRMVRASGRYVSLNHAIAAVLIYDKDNQMKEVSRAISGDKLTPEEKYEKVTKIFAFWSVYLSHAGLARYLTQDHSIRALERLAASEEGDSSKTTNGHYPFNFTFVLLVARLYNSGKIDRDEIDECIRKYGEHSAVMGLLRVVMHIYAYYMPLTIEDKQWVSQKLRMPLKRIEVQRLKGSDPTKRLKASVSNAVTEV